MTSLDIIGDEYLIVIYTSDGFAPHRIVDRVLILGKYKIPFS